MSADRTLGVVGQKLSNNSLQLKGTAKFASREDLPVHTMSSDQEEVVIFENEYHSGGKRRLNLNSIQKHVREIARVFDKFKENQQTLQWSESNLLDEKDKEIEELRIQVQMRD